MLCFEVWLAHKYSSYFSDMSHFILLCIHSLDSTFVELCVGSIQFSSLSLHPPSDTKFNNICFCLIVTNVYSYLLGVRSHLLWKLIGFPKSTSSRFLNCEKFKVMVEMLKLSCPTLPQGPDFALLNIYVSKDFRNQYTSFRV